MVRIGGGKFALISHRTESAVLSWGGTSDVQTQKRLYPDYLYWRPIDVLWEVVSGGLCGVDVSVYFVNIERNCFLDSSLLDAPAPFCMMTHRR